MKNFKPLWMLIAGATFIGATACNKNAAPANDAAGTEEEMNDADDMPMDDGMNTDDDGIDDAADETGETVDEIGDDMTGEPPSD